MRLDELKSGQWAAITGVSMDAPGRRRLLEMGLTMGTPVRLCGHAPFGDPIWLYVRGGYLTMRKNQARAVTVQPLAGMGP